MGLLYAWKGWGQKLHETLLLGWLRAETSQELRQLHQPCVGRAELERGNY